MVGTTGNDGSFQMVIFFDDGTVSSYTSIFHAQAVNWDPSSQMMG
jgi:hypothetical protein